MQTATPHFDLITELCIVNKLIKKMEEEIKNSVSARDVIEHKPILRMALQERDQILLRIVKLT